MKNGELLSFTHHQLDDLVNRQRVLMVALVLGSLYLLLSAFVGSLLPNDFFMIVGIAFIGHRAKKVKEEISELKQYIHGEGVPALT